MIRFGRPYGGTPLADGQPYGPQDCFLAAHGDTDVGLSERAQQMTWRERGKQRTLSLLPYPVTGASHRPFAAGLPPKPTSGTESQSLDESFAHDTLARMNQVAARINELEEALEDPEHIWERLREAWEAAADEKKPRMAEIVRQARMLLPTLKDLEQRLRRVLRRERARLRLDRVQEMDRASMLWLARQPGRTVAERAGPTQRILSVARQESHDTLENRVLHAYTRLAEAAAREWLREHRVARDGLRYQQVQAYARFCHRLGSDLRALRIGIAEPGAAPNYVLLDDRGYRAVREAWMALLRRVALEDELWSWQAESWTDFCALALTISLHRMEEAVQIAQSPLLWRSEMRKGRWFSQENPLSVFWLRQSSLVVEVQARPQRVSTGQAASGAVLWLRVSDLATGGARRIAVWTPHMMKPGDPMQETRDAAQCLARIQPVVTGEVLREGLVLMQAHGRFFAGADRVGACLAKVIALDAVGEVLGSGLAEVARFVRESLAGDRG